MVTVLILTVDADVGDTGAEFDRVFLQELRDLKMFVNDRDTVEEQKRFVWTVCQRHCFFFNNMNGTCELNHSFHWQWLAISAYNTFSFTNSGYYGYIGLITLSHALLNYQSTSC